jgi:hypothetical protein
MANSQFAQPLFDRNRMAKVGRNDLCHCGSGKKYKHCHWKQDQNAAADRLTTRRARQSLFWRMADFFQKPRYEPDLKSAFELFWDKRREVNQGGLTPEESTRFLEWYLVDYRSSLDRQRLIDVFRAQAAGYMHPIERDYLGAWQSSRFGLYEVMEAMGSSKLRVRELLRDEHYDINDDYFAPTMKVGDSYLARLVPHKDFNEFILAVQPIPAEQKEDWLTFAKEKYRLYADAHFNATWNNFLRDSNYLFNHHLLDLSGATVNALGKVVKPTAQEVRKTMATLAVASS